MFVGIGGDGTGDVTMPQVNAAINTHNTSPTAHADIRTALAQRVLNTDPRLTDARTPLPHTHTVSNITDFPTTWAWSALTGVPLTFPPSAHTHTIPEVDGLEDRLTDIEDSIGSPGT